MITFGDELQKYRNNIKRHKGQFGIEIETEAKKRYDPNSYSFWNVKRDDSLRGPGPYEYILKAPVDYGSQLDQALDEFAEKTKGIDFDQESWTTSTHVHVNMLNENLLTLGNFLTIYALTENLLKKYAGPTRESNLFCLPMCDAEENYTLARTTLKHLKSRKYSALEYDQGSNKYAGLNLSSLYFLGSFEVRLLRGTTKTEIIKEWVGILNSILEYSRGGMTPKQFIHAWADRGPELLDDVFGKFRNPLRVKDENDLLEKNFWYASNLAFEIDDWNAFANPPQPKPYQSADLDPLAKRIYGRNFSMLAEAEKNDIIVNYVKYMSGAKSTKKGGALPANNPFFNAAVDVGLIPPTAQPVPTPAWFTDVDTVLAAQQPTWTIQPVDQLIPGLTAQQTNAMPIAQGTTNVESLVNYLTALGVAQNDLGTIGLLADNGNITEEQMNILIDHHFDNEDNEGEEDNGDNF